jgi:hypothetical protein
MSEPDDFAAADAADEIRELRAEVSRLRAVLDAAVRPDIHALVARQRDEARAEVGRLRHMSDKLACPNCGEVSGTDEDGCCTMCGRDVILVAGQQEVEQVRTLGYAADKAEATAERLRAEVSRLRALLAEPSEEEMQRFLGICKDVWDASSLPGRDKGAEQIRAILADLRKRAGVGE